MAQRILIVEDEVKLAGLMRDYLVQEGYEVAMLHRGDEVEAWVRDHPTDLVLLDLMLPGKSGLDVCKALRARGADPSIIMVTARVDEIDRLLGLELGADDYICKPFSPREVVARVKAVLRRSRKGAPPADGGLVLDDSGYKATLAGKDLALTAVEYQLLKVLAAHPGRIYTRDQLIDAMYRDERVVSDRTVDSHIKKIRRKIAAVVPEREMIHSLYGVGYKYDSGTEPLGTEPSGTEP
jgi:two-component system response regulator BaeR